MSTGACQVETVSFHGWPAVRIENGLVRVVAVPDIGGRLMAFELGPYQYLFMNRELTGKLFTAAEHLGDGSLLAWKNYGGDKTWPAPQGWDRADQWPGPPDPILDSGPYTCETFATPAACGLTMTSPPDTRHTGLQIERRVTLRPDQARLRLDLAFTNICDHAVRWAIWDIAQLDCSSRGDTAAPDHNCWLYIPTGTEKYQVMFGDENPQWQPDVMPGILGIQYLGYVGKIGVSSPAGWVAFANQSAQYVFCIRYAYEAGADYPDNGASIECWTESPEAVPPIPFHSVGHLLEAEVLSPFRTIRPGEKSQLAIEWMAARCPGPICAVNEAGCVHRPLSATVQEHWVHIEGIFGCFETGQAQLVWVDSAGKSMQVVPIQPTSPLHVLRIDCVLWRPDGAVSVRLEVLGDKGTAVGDLGEARLT